MLIFEERSPWASVQLLGYLDTLPFPGIHVLFSETKFGLRNIAPIWETTKYSQNGASVSVATATGFLVEHLHPVERVFAAAAPFKLVTRLMPK